VTVVEQSVVAVVSGGLDSVTLAHFVSASGVGIEIVSFDYGQRHRKELVFAESCANRLGAEFRSVDLRTVSELMGGSSLTSLDIEVPDGEYEEGSMRATVVPNRNAIMINIATALAVSRGHRAVAVGVHGGDHFIYPGCRPDFIASQTATLRLANQGLVPPDFEVMAPFVGMSKAEIVGVGDALGVPWTETWSCYRGGETHCGTCGTCIERREAFLIAGVPDPTDYEVART
jgi:7-cyano-7-deazaguanine synthase